MIGPPLRVGIVCPYSLDVPGGVQSHVLDLARALIALGHTVSVLAPADDERPSGAPALPAFVTPAGRAVSVPYNGSVARVTFGPLSYARVRRWLAEHTFDVLHLHEPGTFSLSSLALFEGEGPIVATFHTSTERSRAIAAFARPINALMEKVTARIPCSPTARCCRASPAVARRWGSSAASASRGRGWRCCSTRCGASPRIAPGCGCSWSAGGMPTRSAAPPGPGWPTGSTCSAVSTT